MRSAKDGSRLICQVEQASAKKATSNCMRISFHRIQNEKQFEQLFDFILVDPSLIKSDMTIREDTRFELGIGYKDTLSSIYKMDDIA
jgi:hypothetical protein